jgi:hypothetical protein
MKRLAALGATAVLALLAGCATSGGYDNSAYGYGGYPAHAYDDGYGPYGYPYSYGYPYTYGPTVGVGFSYFNYDTVRGGNRSRGERYGQHAGGFGRPHGPVGSAGLGPQAIGPQARSSSPAVSPNGGMGRRGGEG